MWVEPNGVVRLLTDVPFNKDYENTLYFATREAQTTYFTSKTKVIAATLTTPAVTMLFQKVSYQRYGRNYMKLEVSADKIYDCNYLMFQNTAFGNRWFYAFITRVEYVANRVSRIEYEIDDIQTWFWDCTLNASFVEREHIASDVIGNNRVEEGIDYGDYYLRSLEPSKTTDNNPVNMMDELVIVMAVDKFPADLDLGYYVFGGVGTGLSYFVFPQTADTWSGGQITAVGGISGLNNLLYKYVNGQISHANKDDVIAIFQTPKVLWVDKSTQPTTNPWGYPWYLPDRSTLSAPRTFNHLLSIPSSIGGYTPRNKKLLQYPYNFLYVTDGRASATPYRYEDFVPDSQTNKIAFKYLMQGSCDSSMMIIPQNYKGLTGDNINEKMVYKGFPQNSWSADLWQAYIAQNGGVIPFVASEMISPSADMSMSMLDKTEKRDKKYEDDYVDTDRVEGDFGTEATSILAKTVGNLGRVAGKTLMGNQARGNYNGDIIYGAGLHDFYFGQMTINLEFANRLDEFFDLYGYKVNRVKIPDISGRAHWNYIKTVGLNMEAHIPEEAADHIVRIFEKGIRFWKVPTDKCKYTQELAAANVGYVVPTP